VSGDPIADYLAELRASLRTSPARTAEILAEAEDHLRESATAARQAGHLSEAAAQRAAIEAFGPAKAITRAHRPPVTAFAAAAGLKALPLLAVYVLLSALAGAFLLWGEGGLSHGHSFAPVTTTDHFHGDRKITVFALIGTPHLWQAAAIFGGCVLAGALLVAGFLLVERRGRRSGLALVRLPRGLFPLVAAIVLVAFGVFEFQIQRSYELGWLPGMTGSYELIEGSSFAAELTGVACALWALAVVIGDPAGVEGARRGRRPLASAYAAEAGLKAGQLLGGYLLLSALIGGLLLYLDIVESPIPMPDPGQLTAALAGCVLTGVLLVAGFGAVRQRRLRSGLAPVRLPRGLSLLASAIVLLVLALAEYKYFAGDVTGTLRESEGIVLLILGSQWAAVLLGVGWVLRTVISLVRWALSSWRAPGEAAPPGNTDLATAG
jgi:HAAS domain-containing protein